MSERTLVSFDWALKHLLRDKANFGVLEGWLSVLLDDRITIRSVLESESNRDSETAKYNRVDLLVENERGELCIIEVQNERESHYLERLLFGSSRCIIDHLQVGEDYSKVRKVYSISILYFLLGEGEDDYIYHGTTEFYGLHSHQKLVLRRRKLEALYETCEAPGNLNIFPEYYLIEVERFNDLVCTPLDEWIYFFKHSEIKPEFTAPGMREAREKLDYLHMDEAEKQAYRRYKESLATERDVITTARLEGWEDGRVEGRTEGRAEGIRETACNLLRKGLSPEMVADVTGLSLEDVRALLEEIS